MVLGNSEKRVECKGVERRKYGILRWSEDDFVKRAFESRIDLESFWGTPKVKCINGVDEYWRGSARTGKTGNASAMAIPLGKVHMMDMVSEPTTDEWKTGTTPKILLTSQVPQALQSISNSCMYQWNHTCGEPSLLISVLYGAKGS